MAESSWPTVVGLIRSSVGATVYQVRMVKGGWQDNAKVERLFELFKGREVEVPGHGVFTVDDTAQGLVALLMAETEVLRMDGDPPKAFLTAG